MAPGAATAAGSAKSADAPEKAKKEDKRMSNPATMAGVRSPGWCHALRRGQLRGAFWDVREASGTGAPCRRARTPRAEPTLTKAIRDAVDVAITMCENGEDASQCAVAWGGVEEALVQRE